MYPFKDTYPFKTNLKKLILKDWSHKSHCVCLKFYWLWSGERYSLRRIRISGTDFTIGDWGTCCPLVLGVEENLIQSLSAFLFLEVVSPEEGAQMN